MTELDVEDFKHIFQDLVDDGYSVYIKNSKSGKYGDVDKIKHTFFEPGIHQISIIKRYGMRNALPIIFDEIYGSLSTTFDRLDDLLKKFKFNVGGPFHNGLSINFIIGDDQGDESTGSIRHLRELKFSKFPDTIDLRTVAKRNLSKEEFDEIYNKNRYNGTEEFAQNLLRKREIGYDQVIYRIEINFEIPKFRPKVKNFFNFKEQCLSDSLVNSVTCDKCDWQWNIEKDDDNKYLCHKCGYDNKLKKFDMKSLTKWKKEQ